MDTIEIDNFVYIMYESIPTGYQMMFDWYFTLPSNYKKLNYLITCTLEGFVRNIISYLRQINLNNK